jgi:NADPH:quinone reductase-like Zn-dependent oxidoreductase
MSNRREFEQVMAQLFRGALRPVVDRTFPLKDGAEAQQILAEGKQFGKLVLIP